MGVSSTVGADGRYQRLPLSALPEPVRSYVDACSMAIACDAAYVALPLLSVLAGAIGNSRRVQLKRGGWTEPAILWTAIVGESGTHKSPAIDHARDFPRQRQAQARKSYAAAMDEYQAELAKHKEAMKAWRSNSDGGEMPREPERPVMERAIIDDTTIEAVGPILVDNWRGVLLLRDELAGWLGGFDRYANARRGGGESARWIEMHGGRPVIIDRRTGVPPTLYIPRAALSVGGGIQPGILRRLIGDEHRDNGLLARLLMAWPPRRPRRWTDDAPDESLTAAVQGVYDRLWELAPTVSDGEPAPIVVQLTRDATDMFAAFVNAHGIEQYQLDGDLAAAWSKLEGGAARLALVHHLVRRAYGHPESDIDTESMEAGITLARWFGREDRRIYSMLDESVTDTVRRELVELIRRRGGSIAARQLQQASRKYPTVEAADAALDGLVQAQLGAWESVVSGPRGGRPTRVFRMHQ
jgi:hypothetical protein